jgi:hypothetical protein
MNEADTNHYLNQLLTLYQEKLKRFRLTLSLLLAGTIIIFFLIFLPYMTLLGNREACQANQHQCTNLEESELNTRLSEIQTSWGNVPISTAEVTILFPAGIALGLVVSLAQLQGLTRLRRAINRELKSLEKAMDVTLITPLLIDPQQSGINQVSGIFVLSTPIVFFLYSLNILLPRLAVLKDELPYIQNLTFYHRLYFFSSLLIAFTLGKFIITFGRYRFLDPDR